MGAHRTVYHESMRRVAHRGNAGFKDGRYYLETRGIEVPGCTKSPLPGSLPRKCFTGPAACGKECNRCPKTLAVVLERIHDNIPVQSQYRRHIGCCTKHAEHKQRVVCMLTWTLVAGLAEFGRTRKSPRASVLVVALQNIPARRCRAPESPIYMESSQHHSPSRTFCMLQGLHTYWIA